MRSSPRGIAFAVALAATGCVDRIASGREYLAARNGPMRKASLAPFVQGRIGSEWLLTWLAQRTACTIDGATTMDVVPGPDGTERYGGFANGAYVTSQFGSAASVSADGYFLMAAHCVATGQALVTTAPNLAPAQEVEAVLVWSGDRCDPPIDLAVVFAPGMDVPALAWAPPERASSGAPVLVCGAGTTAIRVAGGTVCEQPQTFAATGSCPEVTAIRIQVPLIPGDSGGPCVSADGLLLGVLSTATLGDGAPQGTVLRPDPNWLAALISRDRAARDGMPRPQAKRSMAAVKRALAINAEIDRLLPAPSRR